MTAGDNKHHADTSVKITDEDAKLLLRYYDKNKNGKLSKEEIRAIVEDYNDDKISDKRVIQIIQKYDTDGNKKLGPQEIETFEKHALDMNETLLRYAGYTGILARSFRYLAFTSDFGEAFRPVAHPNVVNATYAISVGYCFVDVGWEAYKLQKRGYVTEKNEPMTMTQLVVERSIFQAIASVIVPFGIIHTTVDIGKKLFKNSKNAALKKWAPSAIGLAGMPYTNIVIYL